VSLAAYKAAKPLEYMTDIYAVDEKIVLINEFELIHYNLSNGTTVISHSRILNLIGVNIYSDKLHDHLSLLWPYLPMFFLKKKVKKGVLFQSGNFVLRGIAIDDLETLFRGLLKARRRARLPYRLSLLAGLANVYFKNQKPPSGLRESKRVAPQHNDPLGASVIAIQSRAAQLDDTGVQVVHQMYKFGNG
jgi:hypothetical protein